MNQPLSRGNVSRGEYEFVSYLYESFHNEKKNICVQHNFNNFISLGKIRPDALITKTYENGDTYTEAWYFHG